MTRDDAVPAIESALAERGARNEGSELRFCCPYPDRHANGDVHPSARWNSGKAVWCCDACGAGGGFVDLARLLGIGFSAKPKRILRKQREKLRVITPVPEEAPSATLQHKRYGVPSRVWDYRDSVGRLLGHVCRFDTTDGDKQILPRTYCQKAEGKYEWRWHGWDVRRPLFGLDRLTARPQASVIVTEGEKTADAAAALFPDTVTITSPGGAKAAHKSDWSPLRGRNVVVCPDADAPGIRYATEVVRLARAAGATSVRVVDLPPDLPRGWDLADALPDGWTIDTVRDLIERARDTTPNIGAEPTSSSGGSSAGGRPSQATQMYDLAVDAGVSFVHDGDDSYVICPLPSGCLATYAARSAAYKLYLRHLYYRATRKAANAEGLHGAVGLSEATALYDGEQCRVYTRIAEDDQKIYLDLCDERWRAIEITGAGWRVVDDPPVRFRRARGMLALPEPANGGTIDELRNIANIRSDDDYLLVRSWLTIALRSRGPYPVLAVYGEHGSAKTMLCRMLRGLVDPNVAALRAEPRDVGDLIIAARNGWLVALDNVSYVHGWLSDALCRLATGGGIGKRELYTDADEVLIDVQRPTLLNGITEVATRADLLDRCIILKLKGIPETQRRTEAEVSRLYEAARPQILGAICDAVATALQNIPTIRLDRLPRLADFAFWSVAAAPDDREAFLTAYERSRAGARDSAIEASIIGQPLVNFAASQSVDWIGTTTQLLHALNKIIDEEIRHQREWPKDGRALRGHIARIAPYLRSVGYDLSTGERGEYPELRRWVRIRSVKQGHRPSAESERPERQIETNFSDGRLRGQGAPADNRPEARPDIRGVTEGRDGLDVADGEMRLLSEADGADEERF